jgi:hypothetical protein
MNDRPHPEKNVTRQLNRDNKEGRNAKRTGNDGCSCNTWAENDQNSRERNAQHCMVVLKGKSA